ncbi:MAG: META domain-containing protein [Chitinophagaceae bacterium]|nr:META domain-containing protein [Chitinophagaceae bacterium]
MKQFLLATVFLAAANHFLGAPVVLRPVETVSRVADDSVSLAGEWFLVPMLASDTAAGKLPWLRFNLSQRKFSGFTGCNQISGSFTLKADQLGFDQNISLTRMACPGFNEKEFISNLLRVDHYKIKNGVLWLMIDQTPVAKWMRRPDNKAVI